MLKTLVVVTVSILLYVAIVPNITYSITHSQDYRKDLQTKWEKVLRDDKLIKEYEKSRKKVIKVIKSSGSFVDLSHEIIKNKSFNIKGDLIFLGEMNIVENCCFLNKEINK